MDDICFPKTLPISLLLFYYTSLTITTGFFCTLYFYTPWASRIWHRRARVVSGRNWFLAGSGICNRSNRYGACAHDKWAVRVKVKGGVIVSWRWTSGSELWSSALSCSYWRLFFESNWHMKTRANIMGAGRPVYSSIVIPENWQLKKGTKPPWSAKIISLITEVIWSNRSKVIFAPICMMLASLPMLWLLCFDYLSHTSLSIECTLAWHCK